ncbi:MAG: outer membrane beta-barrel protein, partial [Rhodothermales bacterium]|nr:outer membrane beta-barrel protein [Rhodothermales bacterium]
MSRLRTSALVTLAALVAGLLAARPAQAQLYLNLDVQGGVPVDDFEDELDDVGFGVAGTVLYGLAPLPVAVGVEGGVLTYGRQARALPAQIDEGAAFLGEVEMTNRIGHLYAVLRLQPGSGAFRPYLDGLVGFNHFATQTTTTQRVFLADEDLELIDLADAAEFEERTVSNDFDDFAFSYGAGAGVLIRLAAGEDDGRPWEA